MDRCGHFAGRSPVHPSHAGMVHEARGLLRATLGSPKAVARIVGAAVRRAAQDQPPADSIHSRLATVFDSRNVQLQSRRTPSPPAFAGSARTAAASLSFHSWLIAGSSRTTL